MSKIHVGIPRPANNEVAAGVPKSPVQCNDSYTHFDGHEESVNEPLLIATKDAVSRRCLARRRSWNDSQTLKRGERQAKADEASLGGRSIR